MIQNSTAQQSFYLLREEYKKLHNTLHVNEERAKKKLWLFVIISFIVVVAPGLFLKGFEAYDSSFPTLIHVAIILFLFGLIFTGFTILKGLKKSTENISEVKINVEEIRKIFEDFDRSNSILPEDYNAFDNMSATNEKVKDNKRRLNSLYHTASVTNVVLAGTAFAFISFAFQSPLIVSVAGSIISALIMAALVLLNFRNIYELTHAGGLVFKKDEGRKKYLVITSSKDRNRWVLPKGHIEKEETPQVTAIREVMEETGILALPVKAIGYQRYVKSNEKVHVKYYLMKYVQAAAESTEQRKMLWLPKKEAIKQLSFAETKRMVGQTK